MLTVDDLTRRMEESGRHLTPRTARNWWSKGVLPPIQHGKGLGRGPGTTAGFWMDDRVVLQAQIAHDLLGRRTSLDGTAAGLWLLGFPVPFAVVRRAFTDQMSSHYRRVHAKIDDHLENKLWDVSEQFRRLDARARGGSHDDAEAEALFSLNGELLQIAFGVQDAGLGANEQRQWAIDTAGELLAQLRFLVSVPGRLDPSWNLQIVQAEDVAELVVWFRDIGSLARQREAILTANPHQWIQARRIVCVAIGLLERSHREIDPERHAALLPLFTRLAAGWSRVLFPVLLVMTKETEKRKWLANNLFAAAAKVRAGPKGLRSYRKRTKMRRR